ncbi:ABC transporter substrate-binding protein [Butyricicoccus faecihominis]|uniref:ABC transporter substrate-binding protein n=1 Tax=Butyricicoccus faecihominis TaxID=1712515 RepID=UPI002479641E|nr:ABC transporter substrate-binding protein [Butyricicoccus faecihominis]
METRRNQMKEGIMVKRTISLALCGAMLLGALAGCGKGGEEAPIKIGYFGPLTGGTAQSGQAARNGLQIAVDELNAAGGVLGRQVDVIEYDDKSSPEQAVRAATKLVQVDKVDAIFGSLHSGNVLAAAPVIEDSKTLTVAGGTSPTWLQQGYTYLFRALANSDVAAVQLAKYAQSQNFKRIAIFTSNDEYGSTGGQGFIQAATPLGIEFVANETFTVGDRDYTGQFAKINAAEPEAVLVWSVGEELGAVTKQLRQSGYTGPILGPEGYTLPEIYEIAGDATDGVCFAAQYLVYANPEDAEDPQMQAFLQAYLDSYNEPPASDNAYRAYDGMKMIALAMETCGKANGPELRDAYNDIDGYKGLAGTFSYKGKNGEGIDTMRIYKMQGGKFIEAN